MEDHGRSKGRIHAFQTHVGPMRPASTGWLKLRSADPREHPIIEPNYLAEERDRGSLDVIMATPLTSREIVWGKWWGTFAMVPRLAILPIWVAAGASMVTGRGIGPVLMIGLCTPLLRRVIKLAKSQNITSIADFIAARYGKSQAVAATVALIAIIGSVPYIALQLKAVASSLETILGEDQVFSAIPVFGDIALLVGRDK